MNHHLITWVILVSLFISNFFPIASAKEENIFTEDFESGYDGWKRTDGIIFFPKTEKYIVYEGNYAFRMTGIGTKGFSGRFEYILDIPLLPNTTFDFAYYFFLKRVSYVGYQIEFSDGKLGHYFSLFYGIFINISSSYVVQYHEESTRAWHPHQANIYDDYRRAFGDVPSDVHISSVSVIMGDPYFTKKFQTAYFDAITIIQDNSTECKPVLEHWDVDI